MNEVQVQSGHYVDDVYDRKPRFASYWHQIDEIRRTNPESVLEIGVGNGLVRDYLSRLGLRVDTVDIDPGLGPDIVGSVLAIPATDKSYDTVVCCQVLEHLPFSEFRAALAELVRVSKRSIVVSLPDVTRVCNINGRIPGLGAFHFLIPVPRLKKLVHRFDGEHYWEIGKKGYSARRIAAEFDAMGIKLLKTYRVPEHPYHRFFVLDVR